MSSGAVGSADSSAAVASCIFEGGWLAIWQVPVPTSGRPLSFRPHRCQTPQVPTPTCARPHRCPSPQVSASTGTRPNRARPNRCSPPDPPASVPPLCPSLPPLGAPPPPSLESPHPHSHPRRFPLPSAALPPPSLCPGRSNHIPSHIPRSRLKLESVNFGHRAEDYSGGRPHVQMGVLSAADVVSGPTSFSASERCAASQISSWGRSAKT